jgi:2-C-methyl-D-erythritol 4-phosphate cytidylyltransferase
MLSAIIVAAGSSRRMGFDKLLATIAGKPVIAHSIAAFERTDSVGEIIIVTREDRHREIEKIVSDGQVTKVRSVVTGGKHRQDSVAAGLLYVSTDTKYVAVHDAARSLVTPQIIEQVFAKAQESGAASAAEAIIDTLKRADVDLVVKESVNRHQLFGMQTPQIFERTLINDAYRAVFAKNLLITDEVSAVEHLGHKVVLVPNADFNFKITYPRDLPLAEFVLRQRAADA